jgi:hypothetical protein
MKRIDTSPYRPNRPCAHPAPSTMGAVGSSPGVNRWGREADHSTQNSAEVKKRECMYPLSHTPSWNSAYLINQGDKFTFCFCLFLRFLAKREQTL